MKKDNSNAFEEIKTNDDSSENRIKNSKRRYNIIRIAIVFVCVAVCLVCGVGIWNIISSNREAQDKHNLLKNDFESINKTTSENNTKISEQPIDEPPVYSENFLKYRNWLLDMQRDYNEEIIGYISVKSDRDVDIEYPLLKTDNNEFYLTHLYDKTESGQGSIFINSANYDKITENYNTVIYGHSMLDGSMLYDIKTIHNNEYEFKNSEIQIIMLDGIYTFEIFAVYRTTSSFPYSSTSFCNGEEFVAYCEGLQNKSIWKKGLTFAPNDIIITLSTCTNTTENGRFGLNAILRKIET